MSSIWSRIRDGIADLSWGALFELPDVGHTSESGVPSRPDTTRQVGFTIAVIALGAKMAAADGIVTRAEIRAFHEVFQAPPEEHANVEFFFNLARRSATGAEAYARQAARLLDGHKCVLEDLLGALFHIARADGTFDPAEDDYLHRIAGIFGFSSEEYRRIRAYHIGSVDGVAVDTDPWMILGLEPASSPADVKARWRSLVRENHPDTAMAQGLPKEFISIANAKLARINAAYDALTARHQELETE